MDLTRRAELISVLMCFGAASHAASILIDAKEAPLREVVALVAKAHARPLVVGDELGERQVTFAFQGSSRYAAIRWMCRCLDVVVLPGKGRTLRVCTPSADDAVKKTYKVARLLPSGDSGDALVNFLRKVVLSHSPVPKVWRDGDGVASVVCEQGVLCVEALPFVHREVIGVLTTMAKAKKPKTRYPIHVKYEPYECGLFAPWHTRRSPRLAGKVSLDVSDEPLDEVLRALTAASGQSFYPDPWDPALRERHVPVSAEDEALAAVVARMERELKLERVWYDHAWVLVRAERRPLFDGLQPCVYVLAGDASATVADFAEQFTKVLRLSGALPYAVERIGKRLVASVPPDRLEQLDQLMRNPGLPARWLRRLPPH